VITPDYIQLAADATSADNNRPAVLRDLRKNLRRMRKTATLDALFPRTRTGILSAAFTHPEKWWYVSELAEYLHASPSSLQRELASLVASGILQQRREGTRAYFKAGPGSPMFKELRGLFEKTAGLIPTLQQALEPFARRITCAFVYGSVARSKETAISDIDLMVIGSVALVDLAPALRKAEDRLGREINVTHHSVKEFRNKAARKDHFLSAVLRGPKEFVKGSLRDLDEIIG
jgi:predicted nucleotidyltransferase